MVEVVGSTPAAPTISTGGLSLQASMLPLVAFRFHGGHSRCIGAVAAREM